MEWPLLLGLGGIGFAAGTLGAMLGLGGGIVIIPILTLVLHIPMHIAIGTSIIAIVATSSVGARSYVTARLTHIRLGLLLETMTTIGAICGAFIATSLNARALSALFGILLAYIGYSMLRRSRMRRRPEPLKILPEREQYFHNSSPSSLSASYYDQSLNHTVYYQVTHVPHGLAATFFAGKVSGLLGIGGGIIQVPVMNLIMGMPIKAAIATSNFMMGVTAVASAFIYYYRGFILPLIVAPVILGVSLGALLGSRITQKTLNLRLQFIFSMVLLVASILMLMKATNIVFTN